MIRHAGPRSVPAPAAVLLSGLFGLLPVGARAAAQQPVTPAPPDSASVAGRPPAAREPVVAPAAVPATAKAAPSAPADSAPVRLDFQDVDLRVVITALAEAAGLNVVYGELPPRRVTLRMAQPVRRADVPALLRSIAESNGLRVAEAGGFVRLESDGPGGAGAAQTGAAEKAGNAADLRLFVYRLKHAKAPRIAATLQAIFGGSRPGGPGSERRATSLSETLSQQRIPPAGETAPKVQVEMGPAAPGSLPAQLHGEIQIVPEEATNSLLIRAEEADWKVLETAIQSLDLRPLQAMIEVLIVEVRRTRDRDLGISIESKDNHAGGSRVGGTLTGTSTGDFALEIMTSGRIEAHAVISALAARGDARILSRPVIVAQNNEEARILIGSERPFVQVFRSLPTDASIRDQVVQYRDVGTKLTLTPTINPDGYVNLQVTQEVSTATSETQFGAPVISTREAATHLFVRDGQTVVIGGLLDRQRESSRGGIPLLSDIPVIGALFGSGRTSASNSELFLFLTPTIIKTDEDADRVRRGVETGTRFLKDQLPDARSLVPKSGNEPTPIRPPDGA